MIILGKHHSQNIQEWWRNSIGYYKNRNKYWYEFYKAFHTPASEPLIDIFRIGHKVRDIPQIWA